jgi:hypothetical protein
MLLQTMLSMCGEENQARMKLAFKIKVLIDLKKMAMETIVASLCFDLHIRVNGMEQDQQRGRTRQT